MEPVVMFRSSDGKLFATEEECKFHEEEQYIHVAVLSILKEEYGPRETSRFWSYGLNRMVMSYEDVASFVRTFAYDINKIFTRTPIIISSPESHKSIQEPF